MRIAIVYPASAAEPNRLTIASHWLNWTATDLQRSRHIYVRIGCAMYSNRIDLRAARFEHSELSVSCELLRVR